MRFQWWQSVLLEWDSNLANSCSVIEKIKRIYIVQHQNMVHSNSKEKYFINLCNKSQNL